MIAIIMMSVYTIIILLMSSFNDLLLPPTQLDCPAALDRIREDRPITIKDDKGNTSKCIADIVSVSCTVLFLLLLLSSSVVFPVYRRGVKQRHCSQNVSCGSV